MQEVTVTLTLPTTGEMIIIHYITEGAAKIWLHLSLPKASCLFQIYIDQITDLNT